MFKVIPDIPETIDRDVLLNLIRTLGIDPGRLMEMHITTSAVHVLLRSSLPGQTAGIAINGESVAKHQIHIPIVGPSFGVSE